MGQSAGALRRTLLLFIGSLLASALLMLVSLTPQFRPIGDLIGRVVAPVEGSASAIAYTVRDFASNLQEIQQLRRENGLLRARVEYLTGENVQMQELRRENANLREQLGFKQAHPDLVSLPAEVVGRDPASLTQYFIIDKGRQDGVSEGSAVVSPAGLVGRVMEVEATRAKVLLITDVSSSVSAIIQASRTDGIVQGQWQLGGRLLMKYIPQEAEVNRGDWVITSGLGGRLAKGITIGQVATVRRKDTELTQEAEVIPVVNFARLETVNVILGQN